MLDSTEEDKAYTELIYKTIQDPALIGVIGIETGELSPETDSIDLAASVSGGLSTTMFRKVSGKEHEEEGEKICKMPPLRR